MGSKGLRSFNITWSYTPLNLGNFHHTHMLYYLTSRVCSPRRKAVIFVQLSLLLSILFFRCGCFITCCIVVSNNISNLCSTYLCYYRVSCFYFMCGEVVLTSQLKFFLHWWFSIAPLLIHLLSWFVHVIQLFRSGPCMIVTFSTWLRKNEFHGIRWERWEIIL